MAAEETMKNYTVLGYWSDTGMPWVEFARGRDPLKALTTLVNDMARDPEYADNIDRLVILEVIEGRHPGVLGLDLGVPASEFVRKGPKEWSPRGR